VVRISSRFPKFQKLKDHCGSSRMQQQ
jgi:hypothetical protein